MNFLILSCGTRCKIIEYFRRTMTGKGKVIAADMSELAPAIYKADQYYIVPQMDSPDYLDVIFDICRKEQIKGIVSLIDPELSFLARNQKKLEDLGVKVIGSPYELCEMSLDKFRMYCWFVQHKYLCAASYIDIEEFDLDVTAGKIAYPVFVKPVKGSASEAVGKAGDKKKVELLFTQKEGMMIQQFLKGQEIGADVYIDLISGEVISIFTKKKLKMKAGETDKAISFKDQKLFEVIERFVKEAGFRGVIDIDIFEVDGTYYFSEVNPRFGGGYPHAHECGCNFIELMLENLSGRANTKKIGDYKEEVCMMKYGEVMVRGS